jgi:uncharacterized alkaline shock family protein YloU
MVEKSKEEYEFADTVFVRDIESRVFQAIAFKCLMGIEGVELIGGNILDSLLGRESPDRIKGIHIEQDQKNHSVNIKIELNISYGLSIPEKAEEIQSKVATEVCRLTGLHVGSVHVIFKNLISQETLHTLLHDQGAERQLEDQKERVSQYALEYTEDY